MVPLDTVRIFGIALDCALIARNTALLPRPIAGAKQTAPAAACRLQPPLASWHDARRARAKLASCKMGKNRNYFFKLPASNMLRV